ncbi:hypothetical protein A3B05_01405 [Candidatus Giovannonibacteria bacterium RIFCSPLOWO2_01_FULL_43_160]|uniref:Glycosyltransferase RgtA/B/C/D-like domain-containing protein n=2 Tax=Candidatus Giovannoniibacteriota TaxID=1752738 RepID=A0A0G1IWF7_9BACT|nr:MAG: hypothetical protein UV72_C0004G0033 [Candidatus Giovannonibacteria bacterium GW2011_GWB1_43_13]KKS99344.1 MAG: hypothetical protein UV75_C0006G0033 [Candidatus Giovannonibacteria bacterium GW2011_GWA1_43_15]KKT63318.1 MAG: hypothetical protein UW55_C0005G0033 [Candidatus Giovannonibacteria bacterium GW2011_GWA2_44_26]OGF59244.1 MAG: hypothetical protein A2652_00890 [Candidatus Giovannonibacteria bacterium RIFCSPHIGHO2_01_FULL_43_140]OGF70821.1 MAG: hypothetical protein A3C76_03090 [Can
MKNSVYWLILIILIAGFLRFYDLKNTPPGLWSDEAMNGTNTIQALEGNKWKIFYPENFGREGLFINIQSLSVAVFGHTPWALRLPSAIFGLLTVLGLYFLTKELFSGRVALFASFFLATSFWHINFSRMGFRAIMAPFFLIWSFYFLFLGIRKKRESIFILAGLLLGLGAHSYIAYRVTPIIALLPLWKFYKNWQLRRPTSNYCAPCLIGLFIFMAFLAALPLLWYYAQNPADFLGRTSAISIFNIPQPLAPTPIKLVWGLGQFSENLVKTLGMFNFVGDFNWRHNFAGSPQLWWPIGILFLIGIWLSLKKIKWPESFLLLWFVVMILPVALSNESLPHALRAIVLIPPVMIFVALGLEWFWGKIRSSLKIFIFLFFIVATIYIFNQYFFRWAPNFNVYEAFETDITERANWLNGQPKDIKKYVVTDSVDKVDVRGAPMSFQPIIFITDTFFAKKQKEKNIYYLTANQIGSKECDPKCIIVPIDAKPTIYKTLKQKIPNLRLDISPGFVVLKNY